LIIDNKTGKVLNGPAIFLGLTFTLIGIVFILDGVWLFGFPFLLIALFLVLSYSGVEINTETKKIKSYNKFFGLIKKGKWESLNQYKGITLVPMRTTQTIFSRSNRQTTSTEQYFLIYLINAALKPKLPIKKCKTLFDAKNSLDEFSIWLKMPVFSVKK
jgi:hypothetical protein